MAGLAYAKLLGAQLARGPCYAWCADMHAGCPARTLSHATQAHAYAYAYAFNRFEHRPLSLLYVPPVLRDFRRTVAQSVTVSAVSAVRDEVAKRKERHYPARTRARPGCNPAGLSFSRQ